MVERETHHELIPIAILGIIGLSLGAFTKKVRKEIKTRDGGKSVWSGVTKDLTAAHINHDRKNPVYNRPSNGRMLSKKEQYIDHFNRHGTEGLGLDTKQNFWVLRLLWKVLGLDGSNLPPPEKAGKTKIKLPFE